MKKLEAILKGRKFIDRLFGLREKEIKRNNESAKDNVEKMKVTAEIDYENYCKKLGDEDVNYEAILNEMIECKQTIISANATLEAIAEIEADLASEVKEVVEKVFED